jgi:uncharacterized protein (TIGR03066 family)
MNAVRLALAGALVLGVAAARADEEKGGKDDIQKKLIGKWEVAKFKGKKPGEKGPPPGTMVEFTKDGKLVITGEEKGEKVRREGTYKVEGKGFKLTFKRGDMEHTDTLKILKLDDKQLVITSEKEGGEMTLRRKEGKLKD